MYIVLSCSRTEEKCHSVDRIQAELISKVLGVSDMCISHFPFFMSMLKFHWTLISLFLMICRSWVVVQVMKLQQRIQLAQTGKAKS